MSKIPPQFREALYGVLQQARPFVIEHD